MALPTTLIFDGDCGFCTTVAYKAVAKSVEPLRAEAWQLTDLAQYGLTPAQAEKRVYLFHEDHLYAGHQAVAIMLTLRNRWYYSLLASFMLVPPFSLAALLGYRLVARFRHKLPGGTPACKMPNNQ
jgi:predicted DCC family thiol-disulfide oxidoreductase YuxK